MLEELGWPMLKQRRNEAKVIMMYKILNNCVFIDHNLKYNINHTRGHQFKLATLLSRINTYHDSFFPSTIILWNNLPVEVVTSRNLETFKKNCNSYLIVIIFLSKYVHFSSYRGCTLNTNAIQDNRNSV